MVKVSVRYVTKRTNRKGQVRWYWQRPGFPLTRLPDDHVQRYAEAERLNQWADRQRMRGPRAEDSVAALVKLYEDSDRYRDLAPGTRKYYDRKLRDVLKVWADLPAGEIDRRAALEFVESYAGAGERRKARAVLLSLFDVATYRGWKDTNPAQGIRLKMPPKRDQVWSEQDIKAFWQALDTMGWPDWRRQAVDLYMTLCRYTAQRPGDVAAMQWTQYQGDVIRLRQQKTKKLVDVPCHRDLKATLDAADRRSLHAMFAWPDGQQLAYHNLRDWERQVREVAEITEVQARDLRRTAMVRMAEAGAEIHQIAAVSGHSIDHTKTILETYMPRSTEMARSAVKAWESNRLD